MYGDWLAFGARLFLCSWLFWAASFNVSSWDLEVGILAPVTMNLAAPLIATLTAAEVVVAVAILIGYLTRRFALIAAVYSLVNVCIMNSFWIGGPGFHSDQAMNFFQSIGGVGGFLLLAAFGPGKFSADEHLKVPANSPVSKPEGEGSLAANANSPVEPNT